jgi:hypothetical protein
MRVFLHSRCSLLTLGTALVCLAGALLAPAPAQAGCGEHVVVVASLEKNVPISTSALPAVPAKKNAPCSGPHCTRAPLAPTPLPAVPVVLSGLEWACLLEPLILPASRSVPHFLEDPCEHPHFAASGVYHPPR